MDASLKKILRGISLELRHELEGWHDKKTGVWNPGDLERRLNEIGAWGDRPSKPLDEMPHLSAEDKAARRLVDGYLQLRAEAGVERAAAVAEFVRESAYTWANRLFALRCMEARTIIEEVILQKAAYAGRSLVHQRYLRKNPDAAKGEDDGLFAVLFAEFGVRSQELPALFDPKSPAVALRPSVAALKRCVALLSGTETVRGQDPATDEVFAAPDAFGWAYQYWNADEKDRVFEMVRTKKGAKIQGADIIPATQLYTEPYMVKFLVQNSLGALWMGMYPDSKLCERWEYYVKDADRAPVARKPVLEITFLDPAEGSGHFHLEAFDLFYAMYEEEAAREGRTLTPREIAASILNQNLYGIDIDGRSVQIATAALWMKAKERSPELEAGDLTSFHEHLVATNIRLPKGKDHLELFLQKHPEDKDLRPALELVFQGLEHADELGALLQIEELVDAVLRRLKQEADKSKGIAVQTGLFEPTLVQGTLPVSLEDYNKWKRDALDRLQAHFGAEAQAADAVQAFFGESAGKGLTFFNVLSSRYDVVAANPPYMGSKNMGPNVRRYVERHFPAAKRDVFTCFMAISRRLSLGRSAMVVPQTWMFLRSFCGVRVKKGSNGARGIMDSCTIETLTQLGRHAFSEADPPSNVVLITWAPGEVGDAHRLACFRINASRLSEEQAALLKRAVSDPSSEVRFRPRQKLLLRIPESPLVFWLGESFYSVFESSSVFFGDRLFFSKGIRTSDDKRWLRFFWETPNQNRWLCFSKGGSYVKWRGNDLWTIDWAFNGSKFYSYIAGKYPAEKFTLLIRHPRYFATDGWVYGAVGRGSLAARYQSKFIATDTAPTIRPNGIAIELFERLLGWMNSCAVTYFARSLNPASVSMDKNYVERIPLPARLESGHPPASPSALVGLKSDLLATNLTEPVFDANRLHATDQHTAGYAILLSIEAEIDRLACSHYSISAQDVEAMTGEIGVPAGWRGLIENLDKVPLCPAVPPELLPTVERLLKSSERRPLGSAELGELNRYLRQLYETGPGGTISDDESDILEEDSDEDEDALPEGASLPIPAESFLEDLAKKLQVHPVSVYWLLKEGVERAGWRCLPEERRLAGDRLTVLVLRLLGHRWPKQIEADELLPEWADHDGVIAITSGGGETSLIARVSERLAEAFPGGNVAALEREFEEIVGAPLEQWLAGPFFERHISQFKKRPIAWQLETVAVRQAAISGGKGKKKRAAAGKPVFACLVYYHKLDADLLPKIRTQYVGLLSGGFETELRTLERLANPTGDQQARRMQLEQWTDELQAFDRLLEDVSLRGFGPDALRPALRQYGINDALLTLTAAWLRRLSETVAKGPLSDWAGAAAKTELHSDLPKWLQDSLSNLNHFCAVLGPNPPDEKSLAADPMSKELAPLVCHEAKSMVERSLELGCDRWWKPLDAAVLEPLRQEIKAAKGEIEKIDEELKTEGLPFQRRNELGERKHELKQKVKAIKAEHDEKSDRARKVRSEIEKWVCPEAETWEAWLCAQPLFDAVASLDGQRPPPESIADFITQESRYAADINDGVRVNIAPIQKAGLLHADVLDAKDADKAIADRAEWRADERRWVREGKLPQPGWWKENEGTGNSKHNP